MVAHIQPFGYQSLALAKIREARAAGRRKALVVMASGLGKTVVAALDARRFLRANPDSRVLYLCHQNDILSQAEGIFRTVLPNRYTLGSFNGYAKDIHRVTVLFASFQSMVRGRKQFKTREFDYIIVDESHHSHAATYRPTLTYFYPRFLLGVTATPDRMDLQDIRSIFGPEVFSLPLEDALARGLLTPVDYRVVTDDWNFRKILDTPVGRLSMSQLNKTVFVKRRDRVIVRILQDKLFEVAEPRVVIFCRSINYANRLTKLIPGSLPLHTKLANRVQAERLQKFREGRIDTILTVDKLNEGIDVPDANVVVFLRSTASKTIFFQQLGRGLRLSKGKKHVLVLDFVANADRLVMLDELNRTVSQQTSKRVSMGDLPLNIEAGTHFEFNEIVRDVLEVIESIRSGYSKDSLIRLLQRLARQLGRVPTISDFGVADWMPSPTTFYKYFGSYGAALEAAGFQVNKKTDHSRESLINQLQEMQRVLGRIPRQVDIVEWSKRGLGASTVPFNRVFGSHHAALVAAGITPGRKHEYSRKELIEQLRWLNETLGRPPEQKDLKTHPQVASYTTFSKYFGSFNAALKAAGVERRRRWRQFDRRRAIAELRRLKRELGRVPTSPDVEAASKKGKCHGAGTYRRHFGSFRLALEAAGLKQKQRAKFTKTQLVAQLKDLARVLGRTPKVRDINKASKKGECASEATFASYFGSIRDARAAAGLPEPQRRKVR